MGPSYGNQLPTTAQSTWMVQTSKVDFYQSITDTGINRK